MREGEAGAGGAGVRLSAGVVFCARGENASRSEHGGDARTRGEARGVSV